MQDQTHPPMLSALFGGARRLAPGKQTARRHLWMPTRAEAQCVPRPALSY